MHWVWSGLMLIGGTGGEAAQALLWWPVQPCPGDRDEPIGQDISQHISQSTGKHPVVTALLCSLSVCIDFIATASLVAASLYWWCLPVIPWHCQHCTGSTSAPSPASVGWRSGLLCPAPSPPFTTGLVGWPGHAPHFYGSGANLGTRSGPHLLVGGIL